LELYVHFFFILFFIRVLGNQTVFEVFSQAGLVVVVLAIVVSFVKVGYCDNSRKILNLGL